MSVRGGSNDALLPAIAADLVGTTNYQVVKLDLGAAGVSSPVATAVPISGAIELATHTGREQIFALDTASFGHVWTGSGWTKSVVPNVFKAFNAVSIAAETTIWTPFGGAITVGTNPYGVAITPNGAYVYAANNGAATVSVIATATNTVVATIAVAAAPNGVAITPNGAYVYVANSGAATVSVIATATNTVVATIAVGSTPAGVAITPNGAYVYVANFSSGTVSVIATATNTVVATITVGTNPYGVAITPNGAYVYAANNGAATVSVIATATNTVVATIAVGSAPIGVAITPNGAYVYAANSGAATVSVIATATNTIGTRFRLLGYNLVSSVAGNILLRDNTAGTIIAVVPSAAGGPGAMIGLGSGITSAAKGNVLTAIGPAASTLSGVVLGIEE